METTHNFTQWLQTNYKHFTNRSKRYNTLQILTQLNNILDSFLKHTTLHNFTHKSTNAYTTLQNITQLHNTVHNKKTLHFHKKSTQLYKAFFFKKKYRILQNFTKLYKQKTFAQL